MHAWKLFKNYYWYRWTHLQELITTVKICDNKLALSDGEQLKRNKVIGYFWNILYENDKHLLYRNVSYLAYTYIAPV